MPATAVVVARPPAPAASLRQAATAAGLLRRHAGGYALVQFWLAHLYILLGLGFLARKT